ncbi:7844_t:CDS:10, partial [Scutellospora calospora]
MSWQPAFTTKIEDPVSIANLLKPKQTTPNPPSKPITISIVGAGQRGSVYARYTKIEPQWAKVVAVAEPVEHRRRMMAELYNIPEENVFTDWEEMIKRPKLSDAVIIATFDNLHIKPAIEFANKKYNILLEKPMADTIKSCKEITNTVLENKIVCAVGHVLRYTPHNTLIKSIIDGGYLGNIVNIQHVEPVGEWHFAHSKISSFGSLMHFNSKNKPKEAGDAKNCFDCKVEPTCPYSAKKIYIDNCFNKGVVSWPVNVITDVVVNMQFSNGATANITMIAYTEAICERKCNGVNEIKYYNFLTRKKEILTPTEILGVNDLSGHAGGDMALMRSFIYNVNEFKESLKNAPNEQSNIHLTTGIKQTF